MKKNITTACLIAFLLLNAYNTIAQTKNEKLLFGVAYYDEYMPYDRSEKDVSMMKEAGINVVRIAESTWGTVEPQDNIFNFKHIDRVLNAVFWKPMPGE
jgi:beta-galactosidase